MVITRTGISKRSVVILGVVAVICAVAIALGLYFGIRDSAQPPQDGSSSTTASVQKLEVSDSDFGVYWNAAVATNGHPCAIIGRNILMKNGSAVEAAIAAMFCDGVTCSQSMGLGGGFLMTIYKRDTGRAEVLNARETAPSAASETMFGGNETLSRFGGLSVAVPGELMGYWQAYQKYKSGNVQWSELVQPTIDVCRQGITVTKYVANTLKNCEKDIRDNPSISEILINPATNKVWLEGDKFKRLKLADTLEIIRDLGAPALYNGTLTKSFVKDIQDFGGIITEKDMNEYEVKWSDPIVSTLKNNIKMYTVPSPGSGALLALMLNILNEHVPAKSKTVTYQRITEAFKHAYGRRTSLGDPDFVNMGSLMNLLTSEAYAAELRKNISDTTTSQNASYYGANFALREDHGTAHISVLAPNGDAVSVTSTINLLFGSMLQSPSTGIILNNEMDDFSAPNITNAYGVPPSPSNYIKPHKRPMSSMVPSIFVDDGSGDVKLVTGAAGGTKITTATALVAMNVLWFNMTIKEAIDARRFHHQLFPMNLQYEKGMAQDILAGLRNIGHNLTELETAGSSVTGIARSGDKIYANSDFRRNGVIAGF